MRADDAVTELINGALMVEAVLLAVAVVGALLSRRRFSDRLGLGAGSLSAGRISLLVVGTLAISFALDGCIDVFGLREGSTLEDFTATLAGAQGLDLLFALLALGIAPGVAEELLCRGLVQRGLEARLGTVGAVSVAALFFGALHVDPVHAGVAVPLGLYLGAGAAGAGSIRPAILCHASNNLLAVYTAARFPELSSLGPVGIGISACVALACLVGAMGAGRPAPDLQIRGGLDDL